MRGAVRPWMFLLVHFTGFVCCIRSRPMMQDVRVDPDRDRHPEREADHRSVAEWISGWGREVDAADIVAGRRRFTKELSAFGTHADVVHGRDAVEEQQWSQIWPAIEDF